MNMSTFPTSTTSDSPHPLPGDPAGRQDAAPPGARDEQPAALAVARDYLGRGFAVVPQLPGAKHPCVRWKDFQGRLPTPAELEDWFGARWPNAGMAAVLGPVGGLFAIDVDGPGAHEALLGHLGAEPAAPKVLSGSGQPCRYHLFFRHPEGLPTRARITPWHPQLEFRGHGGILVLPPSLHKSGNAYRWAPGRSLDEVPLGPPPEAVLQALRERAAADTRAPARPGLPPGDRDAAVGQARAYLAKVPPSVEGQGGDRHLFTAACLLVVDFALTREQALPLLEEYNRRSRPPWSTEELRHKLMEADKRPGERGRLLTRAPAGQGSPGPQETPSGTSGGEPFLGSLPNFVLADWWLMRPRPPETPGRRRGRRRVTAGMSWVLHHALVTQRCSHFTLVDVVVAQCFWGGRPWPRNWRRRLLDRVYPDLPPQVRRAYLERACPAACPLSGRADVPHWHLPTGLADPEDFLGCLQEYATDSDRLGVRFEYDFALGAGPKKQAAVARHGARRRAEEFVDDPSLDDGEDELTLAQRETVRGLRKQGRAAAVYLPALLLGASPRCSLSRGQRDILTALTHEITRAHSSTRADKAHLVVGGARDTGAEYRVAPCPFLETGVRYVGFNGNGSRKRAWLRGRGYHLLGRTGGGWLSRAGYAVPRDAEGPWKAVRRFLGDLEALSEPFGLVAAGWHPDWREWRPVGEMAALTRTPAGRHWLRWCWLRVYTPADYLIRWRAEFARRMGFSFIPGDSDEGDPAGQDVGQSGSMVPSIGSPVELDGWMRARGMTDQELAGRLGVSRSYVSRLRAGRRPWSRSFEERLAGVLSEQGPQHTG
jgi:hypothetical protein